MIGQSLQCRLDKTPEFCKNGDMPKRSSTPEDPDHQQIARSVLDAVAPDAEPDQAQEPPAEKTKNPVALGRLGGLKGGKARAAKLTPERRSEIAKKAAAKRWGHDSEDVSSSSS